MSEPSATPLLRDIALCRIFAQSVNSRLPPQPPPDAPAPPPGEAALASRRKMKAILWVAGLCLLPFVLIAILVVLSLPQRKAADRTSALNNIRSVGCALYEFDSEYGRFPDASTAPLVKATTKTPLTLGHSSSNQLFRQLIAIGLKSEKPFYAAIAGFKKPDDRFLDDAHALAPGECGYAYIAGLDGSMAPETPVIVSPLIPGTTRFDPKPFGGKAVILRLDNSARSETIDSSGRVMSGGMDIFDPRQPCWGGKAPDIKWQE